MGSNCPFLNELWHDLVNKPYKKKENKELPPLDDLWVSEWSEEFITLMHNRMVCGAFRYGKVLDSNKSSYKRISSIIERLKLYLENGNKEHLVDAAAISMAEFIKPSHKNSHFRASDDHIHMKEMK